MTIVVAAEVPAAAAPLAAGLEARGHDVILVDDVENAWNALGSSGARVVIADWSLPGGGGPELCRRIRRRPTSLYTYVTVVADEADDALRLEGLVAGADDFLARPLVFRELVVRLENARRILAMQQELERENSRLAEQALVDALTGLKNRRYFHQVLDEAYYRAVRHEQPLSLVMVDVDHFKRYNDRLGHPAGDELLRTVAGLLRAGARDQDTVARYGGEEFVLLLPGTDAAGGRVVSERLRHAIATAAVPCAPVTASLGVATLGKGTVSAAYLLAGADAALYRSKQTGRNRVTHEDDLCSTPPDADAAAPADATPFAAEVALAR